MGWSVPYSVVWQCLSRLIYKRVVPSFRSFLPRSVERLSPVWGGCYTRMYVRGALLTWNGTTPVWGLVMPRMHVRGALLTWNGTTPVWGLVMPWMYVRGTLLTWNGTTPVWGWLCLGCMSVAPCSPGMAPPLYGGGYACLFHGALNTLHSAAVAALGLPMFIFMNIPLRGCCNHGSAVWDHLGIQKFTVANGTLLVEFVAANFSNSVLRITLNIITL